MPPHLTSRQGWGTLSSHSHRARGSRRSRRASRPRHHPRGIQLETGDYTWKLGGYLKVDLIHDFDEIGSTDSFDVRTIPTTETADGDATRIHARQTRINLDVTGPTSAGPFRAFVEGDFFSDQNGFRMRHAYGTIGEVLGGQTWSTFMDEDAMPETLDFESPVAFPLVRQAQVRWTHQLGDGNYFALALEDPDSDVIGPTGVTGTAKEPLPDVNARVRWKNRAGTCSSASSAAWRASIRTSARRTTWSCGA
jgi:hypothetical protein